MASLAGFSTLVGKTYEGAVTHGDWSRTSACLARQFDARSAQIGTLIHPGDGTAAEHLVGWGDPGGEPESVESVVAEALSLPRGVPLVRSGGIAAPSGRTGDAPAYRALGLTGHVMALVTEPAVDYSAFLCVVRDEKRDPFSIADVEAFLAAGQHVRRAIQMSSRRSGPVQPRPSDQLDVLGHAVFLFDSEERVVSANTLADGLVRLGDGIALRAGRLRARSDIAFEAALAAITAAAAEAGFHDRPSPVFFTIRQGDGRRLSAMLAMAPREWLNGAPGAMLVVSDPTRHASPPVDALRREFGLSEAEIRFLLAFMKLFSIRDTAQALGIGPETARRHLKSIFAKTETSSQAELTQMVLLHPASLLGGLISDRRV